MTRGRPRHTIEHVFDNVPGDLPSTVEDGARSRLSRFWAGVWAPAVLVAIAASVVALLVVAVELVLPGSEVPMAQTTEAPPLKPADLPLAASAAVRTDGGPLSERSGPSTYSPVRGHIADGATVTLLCQVYGQRITGAVSTSDWWEVDAHGLYVSDGWLVFTPKRPTVPWCGASTHRPVTATVHVGDDGLSVRTGPEVDTTKVGTLTNGVPATVACRAWGDTIAGAEGTTAYWAMLTDGRYVSEAYLHWAPDQPFLPWCGEAPQTVPPATASAFIASAVKPAQASQDRYDVPAAVTIAQAILESGWGASTLTRVDHSLFGMKCFGTPGPVALGCRDYGTHECDTSGHCYATSASFRVYQSETQSFQDHGLMLATLPRYQPAFVYENQPDKFAQGLQSAGYATSTRYAKNLIALMTKYNLYQYDLKPPPPRKAV
jgi:uncharacterized protein YraI